MIKVGLNIGNSKISCAVIEIKDNNNIKLLSCESYPSKILKKNSVYYEIIGKTQKDNLEIDKELKISLIELNNLSSFWFKNYFKEK